MLTVVLTPLSAVLADRRSCPCPCTSAPQWPLVISFPQVCPNLLHASGCAAAGSGRNGVRGAPRPASAVSDLRLPDRAGSFICHLHTCPQQLAMLTSLRVPAIFGRTTFIFARFFTTLQQLQHRNLSVVGRGGSSTTSHQPYRSPRTAGAARAHLHLVQHAAWLVWHTHGNLVDHYHDRCPASSHGVGGGVRLPSAWSVDDYLLGDSEGARQP